VLSLFRRLTASKPLAFSIVAILILAAVVPAGLLFLGKPEPAAAQQRPAATGLVVRTVPVGIGPISTILGYAGAVQSTRQINVVARSQGLIQDVPVDVGSVVHRGDTLAVLDQGALPAQLLQSQAALLSARAKLAQIEAGARPEDVTAAEAQVTAAQIRLVALQEGRPEDVTSARAALDSANAKLSLLMKGAADDARQAAQSAVDSDSAQLLAAQAALDNFTGSSAADLQTAQGNVDSDKAALAAAQAALDNLKGANAADLQAALSAVETDNAQIAAALAAIASLTGTSAADIQAAQSAVVTDRALVTAAQAAIDMANSPTDAQIEAARALIAAAQASVDSSTSTRTGLDHPSGTNVCVNSGSACNAARICSPVSLAAAWAASGSRARPTLPVTGLPSGRTGQEHQVASPDGGHVPTGGGHRFGQT